LRDAIEIPHNQGRFSTAVIWEIAVKARIGRPDFSVRPEAVATATLARGFDEPLNRLARIRRGRRSATRPP